MPIIPDRAKKFFSGIMFDIYQWEQELFDGSTTTFEKAWRMGNTQIIAVVGDKIMVCEEHQPAADRVFFGLPGGRIERGEDELESSKRELLEETGLESGDWELWLELDQVNHVAIRRVIYIARNAKKVTEPTGDPGEKISCQFISFDDFVALGKDPDFTDQLLKIKLLEAHYDEMAREELQRRLGL